MRVLQGHGVGAFQDNPPEDPDAEFLDTRRTGGQDEVRPVRQAARAILSGEAERRAGICQGLLSVLVRSMGTSSALNMLREYANNVSFDARGFIEQVGGYSLDSVAMGHKLRLPRDAWRTLRLCDIIHRGVTDLAWHYFPIVHHRKCERHPLVVVSHNLAPRQRHSKFPSPWETRMRRPVVAVENLRPSRRAAGPLDRLLANP